MFGLMQDRPLLISDLIEFAARHHLREEMVSRSVEGPIHRYTYPDCAARSRTLAKALAGMGVAKHDRSAPWPGMVTGMWRTARSAVPALQRRP